MLSFQGLVRGARVIERGPPSTEDYDSPLLFPPGAGGCALPPSKRRSSMGMDLALPSRGYSASWEAAAAQVDVLTEEAGACMAWRRGRVPSGLTSIHPIHCTIAVCLLTAWVKALTLPLLLLPAA